MIRTGIGFDIHRLVPGRRLVLGGVTIDFHLGLEGHSDADVLCHAVADAFLGAVADGDIGTHFPDTDAKWKNVNSLELLALLMKRLKKKKARIVNIDATILAEEPLLRSYREAMRRHLARVLGTEIDAISVKATTAEGLGAVGRGEGIAVMAVATVEAG